MKRPAVFFDRDNTLIANDGYLGDPDGVVLVDGAADAVARVRGMGFAAITFSNQSGVVRGMFTEEAVHAVNARLDELLQEEDNTAIIGRHEFCPFHPEGTVEKYRIDSELRKPSPGMIFQAARRLELDLSRSWVIGDAPRDIEAGKAAGCKTILFVDPKLSASPATAEQSTVTPDYLVTSLKAAVDIIVNEVLGPIEVVIPPPPPEPVVEPAPEAPPAAAEATPPKPEVADVPAELQVAPAAPVSAPTPEEKAAPADVSAKFNGRKPSRSASKMTFAERVKAGTFVPPDNKTSGQADAPTTNGAGSQQKTGQPRTAKAPAAVKAARVRKPTFAERVRAGTFVKAENEPTAPAVETMIDARPILAYSPIETEPEQQVAAPAASAAMETVVEPPPPPEAVQVQAESPITEPVVEAKSESKREPAVTEETKAEAQVAIPAPIVESGDAPTEVLAPSTAPQFEGDGVAATAVPETKTETPEVAAAAISEITSETTAEVLSSATETPNETPSAESTAAVRAEADSIALNGGVNAEAEIKVEDPIVAPPPSDAPSSESPPARARAIAEPIAKPPPADPVAPAETQAESPAVKPTPSTETKMETTTSTEPQTPATPSTPAKKMTFAERVKSGTFQAERAAAAAAPDRPKRVMPMPGDKPQTQASRVIDSLTAVRPTQPVTPEEQLEPILQSILEELRLTREGQPESDFSLAKLVAGIVQVLVLPALFFAFMDRKVPGDLQSMLMLATFLQTLVIALLIMGRSK